MNTYMVFKIVFIWVLVGCGAAFAEEKVTKTDHSQPVTTEHLRVGPQQLHSKASEWGLTDEEWSRYQELNQGRRGLLSPGLDPLTMLGIEARTDEERRRYAELIVRQDFERVEAELAFQREVTSAWKRLYPDVLPIQPTAVTNEESGRLALFVRDDCRLCEIRLAQLLQENRPLDIYLVGSAGNDDAVLDWAHKQRIPTEKVKSRLITLNHDDGAWLRFGQGRMPALLSRGENGWRPVN